MMDQRTARAVGNTLLLDGIDYQLKSAAIKGSVIVYEAAAEGSSIWEDILIRELFPCTDGVRRGADDLLFITDKGRTAMLRARRAFAAGQKAEAALLHLYGGDSRILDAYGTSYVVRRFPKAVCLQTVLEQGALPPSMTQPLMEQLLDAVELLHQQGLLHLGIAPQRIYLLSGRQLFLDHDCLWDTHLCEEVGSDISNPYAAPEVRLCNLADVGTAADLFSCCAVLFALLLGRSLRQDELLSRSLYRSLLRALEALPSSAAARTGTALLLNRGLHTLPHRRFQSAAELRYALHSLLPLSPANPPAC